MSKENKDVTLFTMRQEAAEGKVFYQNLLATPGYSKKYFPATPGETDAEYLRRPKISVPITSSIIDRITNILMQGSVITASSDEAQERLDSLLTPLNLYEFLRDMVTNTIVTGNNLSLIRIIDSMNKVNGPDSRPKEMKLENWDGTWVYMNKGVVGYEYTERDGLMVPVLSSDVKEDQRVIVIIDDLQFDGVKHKLPYNPSTLLKNIDKYDDEQFGKSFVMRFNNLAVEYNQVVSQISKSIKVLQNVWITNRDVDNPENPIRLSPDRINFLGVDGILQQAVRNLDLSEEREYLNILEHQISRTSQVPAELSGLKDVGKLPSGIALQILLQPLTELTERMRVTFVPGLEDFIYKVLATDYILDGQAIPKDLEVSMQVDTAVLPEDRTDQINEIILLKKEGLITPEQAQLLLEPIIGIDLTTGPAITGTNEETTEE